MNRTTARMCIGIAVAVFGMVALFAMLYLLLTSPFKPGDPDGSITKAILTGAVGLFGVAGGYAIVNDDGKSGDRDDDAAEGADGDTSSGS